MRTAPEAGRPFGRRVVVVGGERTGERPSGPSLRAAGLAAGLRAHGLEVEEALAGSGLPATVAAGGTTIVNLSVAARSPELLAADHLVVDAAGPYLVESLWVNAGRPGVDRRAILVRESDDVARVLAQADLILVASGTQRSLVLGLLLGRGLLRPELIDGDPALSRLVVEVPFGLIAPPEGSIRAPRPERAGGVLRLVWPGGLWDWLDPQTLVAGVAAARAAGTDVQLELWGTASPDPNAPRTRLIEGLRAQIEAAGVADSVRLVDWVPYADVRRRLAAADLAVTLDPAGIEARFAYRTRLVEALAAGLPILATSGEEVAGRAAAVGAGWLVGPGDVDAVAERLTALAGDPRMLAAASARTPLVVSGLGYDELVQPLADFCRAPRRQRPGAPARRLTARLGHLVRASRARGRR